MQVQRFQFFFYDIQSPQLRLMKIILFDKFCTFLSNVNCIISTIMNTRFQLVSRSCIISINYQHIVSPQKD